MAEDLQEIRGVEGWLVELFFAFDRSLKWNVFQGILI